MEFLILTSIFLLKLLQHVKNELLIFALVWIFFGMADEFVIDICYLFLKWRRGLGARYLSQADEAQFAGALRGPAAVLIPAWHEAEVIGATVASTLMAWQQPMMHLFVGCYNNDPATRMAAQTAGAGDLRLHVIDIGCDGPSTKGDCLNRLYTAMCDKEASMGQTFRTVVLQDAEDMVHPLALGLIDAELERVDFVQIPVRPALPAGAHWVAGHYADEFAEEHAKGLMVRDALGLAIPAAGVGCGFRRSMLARIAFFRENTAAGPFASDCLTEDYELGMIVALLKGRARFVRCRDSNGDLIATRSYFPNRLPDAVRQKARWIHGIALQAWDMLGWSGRGVDMWMAARDRRAPFVAMVLAAAYLLMCIALLMLMFQRGQGLAVWARLMHDGGLVSVAPLPMSPAVYVMLWVNFVGLIWRSAMRGLFTTREYGVNEGWRALLRIPLANLIVIMAGRAALKNYIASLRGKRVSWAKTEHHEHPAMTSVVAKVKP